MRWGGICLLVAGSLLICGCGGEPAVVGPETVPLTGKVVFTKGGNVTALSSRSGSVEFQSIEQPDVKAVGSIAEDGSFTMATRVGDTGKLGVVSGKHRVRLGLDDNAQHLVAPKFLRFDKSGITVTVPSETPVEIKVWK